MKKFYFIFIILFVLFSCNTNNNETTIEKLNTNSWITTISKEEIEFNQNTLDINKENAKKCIQTLDINYIENIKEQSTDFNIQAFSSQNKCYYIYIQKWLLPLYLVFSFDDNRGILNNNVYYFFDQLNIQDFDWHDYQPIKWSDFINSLDNLFIENNIEIPHISYNLESDLQNNYFISNSIYNDKFENILEKIWNFRNSIDYKEKKEFFKNEDQKIFIESKEGL